MRKYFCVVFCFLCTFACTDHYDAPSDKDVHLDTKLALNNIMTYINHNDKSMGYLTERNYSAADVKTQVIPLGAYKKENSKYINIKLCRE